MIMIEVIILNFNSSINNLICFLCLIKNIRSQTMTTIAKKKNGEIEIIKSLVKKILIDPSETLMKQSNEKIVSVLSITAAYV